MSAPAALVLATAAAVAALLGFTWAGRPRAAGAAKLLASTGFLAFAWLLGAAHTPYGVAVLVALGLSWIGDAALIPTRSRGAFLLGLGAFLLGHVAYVAAFGLRPWAVSWLLAALPVLGAAAVLAWRWLSPHVEGGMRGPVAAYVGVISVMAVTALAATGGSGDVRIAAGALAFYVSDLAVARERFVASSPWNRTWGLPLYYGGQLLLASSVALRATTPG
ncbi:MAG: lysoplasmalogenase [Myxococcota bacterium]|nr:lysoplasmalogenase [Myxococcota bacterium]